MRLVKNIFIKIFGWIVLIIGLFGWLIPIPIIPFFLLFFIGIHILGYDSKLLSIAGKLGFDTDRLENNLNRVSKKKKVDILDEIYINDIQK